MSPLLRLWYDKDAMKRPTCAIFVELAHAVLEHADGTVLLTAIASR